MAESALNVAASFDWPLGGLDAEARRDPATHLHAYIDHTLLKPTASPADIAKVCDEAVAHRFASVCVNGCHVPLVAARLHGTGVRTCAVAGFPLGAMSSRAKAAEVATLVADGADEVDMVLNVGLLLAGDHAAVLDDLLSVRQATLGRTLKVIFETSMLTHDAKVAACVLCRSARVDFVKTSTGFGGGGATVDDIALMRQWVGPEMGVKASGGVRSREDALRLIEAGATRLGTSSGVALVAGASPTSPSTY